MLIALWLKTDEARGSVGVVGDFNEWEPVASPMNTRPDDSSVIEAVIRGEAGCRYELRYLSDTIGWFDDESVEKVCSNPYGGNNCVVYTPAYPDIDIRVMNLTATPDSSHR